MAKEKNKSSSDISKHFHVYTTRGENGLCNVVKFTTEHINESVFPEIKEDVTKYFNSIKHKLSGGKYHNLDMGSVKHADSHCLSTILMFKRLSTENNYGVVKITNCQDAVEKIIKASGTDKVMSVGYKNSNYNNSY